MNDHPAEHDTNSTPDSALTSSASHAKPREQPLVTVDIVLFVYRRNDLAVLLVRRKHWPYAGHWALPGGFVEPHETLEEAAQRELWEETNIRRVILEQFHAFGDPGRDPRARIITVAYFALLHADQMEDMRGGDDAAEARWWPVNNLPALAFDHERILARALQALRQKLERVAVGFSPLPETLTLRELQAIHRATSAAAHASQNNELSRSTP